MYLMRIAICLVGFSFLAAAQEVPPAAAPASPPQSQNSAVRPAAAAPQAGAAAAPGGGQGNPNDTVLKALDDIMWVQKLSDIADVDKIAYASLPPAHVVNKTAPGATNTLIIHAYTFIPKKLDRTKKQPLLVLAHQGVHGNVSSAELGHIMREFMEHGWTVIAPDYRGSTGYGQGFYQQIDYGGREVDDVFAAREWMLDRYPFLDPKRVGMIGWSHGGMITLLNILQHPQAFAVAYAGVPVTDLVLRLGNEDGTIPGPCTRRPINRQNGARGYSGISAPLADYLCGESSDAFIDPHEYE